MRVGIGNDVHRLVAGRDLILGGVKIPYDIGLLGHSDADVLLHAVCDALLGAAGLGDIGLHFPDTEPEFKGISSITLLERTLELVKERGFSVVNVDTTIFAERPKLSLYREAMRNNISKALEVSPESVNVKATTTEGLGIFGRGEGIGAMCIAMLETKEMIAGSLI